MFAPITVLLYALPLVAAAWVLVKLVANKPLLLAQPADRMLFRFLIAIEIVVLAQAVVGFVALATIDRDVHTATFVAYLVGLPLLLPIAGWWALGDRTRGGTGVLIVANLTLPAMVLRLTDVWAGHA